ncbi:MAG: CAP domain-containing protein [Candidatus Hydromicrobium sp.]
MRVKLKIILIITLATALIATIAFSSAFSFKAANIDRSFTESSTYKTEDIGKAAIIKENICIKDNSIDTGTILSRISDNLDKEINSIYKEYKAEVLGNAITIKATEIAAAPVESTTNLNEFEAAVLYLINTIRVSNGLGALQPNQMLTDIARSRCNDMIVNSYFSHYTPDGRNIFNIFRENGVSYVNAGENLGQSSPASYGTPEAFADAWMASPTHKANILRSVYSKIGIGVVDGEGRRVVATVFIN